MHRGSGQYTKGRTRYQPLVDYLVACGETESVLTFAAIEAIIGGPLTDSAYVNADIWRRKERIYVQRWRAQGWEARLDRRNRCVIFTHDVEGGAR